MDLIQRKSSFQLSFIHRKGFPTVWCSKPTHTVFIYETIWLYHFVSRHKIYEIINYSDCLADNFCTSCEDEWAWTHFCPAKFDICDIRGIGSV